MTAKNSYKFLEKLFEQITVDRVQWDKAMEDKKRITVLNHDALLDMIFRRLLERHFSRSNDDEEIKHLFNIHNGPLSTLPNKARMAYVLGLIDKATCDKLKKYTKSEIGLLMDWKLNL